MRGYLIIELAPPDDEDGPTFPRLLADAKETLEGATIERVTHVHAAIGLEGLEETVAHLRQR